MDITTMLNGEDSFLDRTTVEGYGVLDPERWLRARRDDESKAWADKEAEKFNSACEWPFANEEEGI